MSENLNLLSDYLYRVNDYSKETVEKLASVIVTEYELGPVDPVRFLGRLEFLSQVLEKAKGEIRDKTVSELEKYGAEARSGVKLDGNGLKLKESGVRYDYSSTPLWIRKKSEIDLLNEDLKNLETVIKSVKTTTNTVDEETGEILEIKPPIKTSKTTIEITLPKK